MESNYYDVLGISQDATQEQIKRAYREKILKWHPDKNPGRDKEAEKMAKLLNEAYEMLGNPQKRQEYDNMRRYAGERDFEREVDEKSFYDTLKKASPALKDMLEAVENLFHMFKDGISGRFEISGVTLATIGGALLYLISPIDIIPDFIPLAGYLDDAAVLSAVIASLGGEIDRYKAWRYSNV